MKKTIRYLLSGLALLSLGACTSSDNEDGSGGNDGGLTFVTVVSFNIRVDNAADGDNAWDNRKPASAAMIRQERPTVMGLQEAQPHQITYLAKNCPDWTDGPVDFLRERRIPARESPFALSCGNRTNKNVNISFLSV